MSAGEEQYRGRYGLGGHRASENDDGLRSGYGDFSKVAGGLSPAMGQSGVGRPGSAANPPGDPQNQD